MEDRRRNTTARDSGDRPSRDGSRGRGGVRSGGRQRRGYSRRKVCRFCTDSGLRIDYKESRLLRNFVTERGKILPRRISGNCAKHQREITQAVKRARHVALLPFTTLPR